MLIYSTEWIVYFQLASFRPKDRKDKYKGGAGVAVGGEKGEHLGH